LDFIIGGPRYIIVIAQELSGILTDVFSDDDGSLNLFKEDFFADRSTPKTLEEFC
jgi:hypothetical protein